MCPVASVCFCRGIRLRPFLVLGGVRFHQNINPISEQQPIRPEPLKYRPHLMMVSIGMAPEGWGFLSSSPSVTNKSCCTKQTKKQARGCC